MLPLTDFLVMHTYSLEYLIYMQNSINWLKNNFALPKNYEWEAISWNYDYSCPCFSLLRIDLDKQDDEYNVSIRGAEQPWIDTILLDKDRKKFSKIIKWTSFRRFIIIDKDVINEIKQMNPSLEPYRLYLSNYIIKKKYLTRSKATESFLAINKSDIVGKFDEINTELTEKYGYRYLKEITQNNDSYYIYDHTNPIEYYTMIKLEEN